MPQGREQGRETVPQARAGGQSSAGSAQLDKAVTGLHDAILSSDNKRGVAVVQDQLKSGLAATDIADIVIPRVSHLLGDQWCEDQIGFAQVTIGAARLQSLLRLLGPDWSGDRIGAPGAPTILLIVPENTLHTLGAMVLAGQLRRRGFSVKSLLGVTPADAAAHMGDARFEAVFISAAISDSLETLRQIVKSIHYADPGCTPIVIGGSIEHCTGDIADLTGADYVTSNLEEALRLCQLSVPEPATPGQDR